MELPEEDYSEEDRKEDREGRLAMSLYGTRDAAQNWQNTVERNLKKIGFRQGVASSSVYYNEQWKISTLVHGDDYVSVGSEEQMKWLKTELENVN